MYRLGVFIIFAVSVLGLSGTVHAQYGGTMSDYMTMRVCTASSAPGAAALPGVVPGDIGCTHSRQIQAGEAPTYTLRDFAANFVIGSNIGCGNAFGPLVRVNVPVTQNGLTHFTIQSHSNTSNECQSAQRIGGNAGPVTWSVEHVDPVSGYASILGSTGVNGVTLNDAYQYFPSGATTGGLPYPPVCKTSDPFSWTRFLNSWIVGQGPVSTSLPGPIQYAVSELALVNVPVLANEATLTPPCSTPYVSSFHIWRAAWFTFYSGRTTSAVIAAHYTQANSTNNGPGASQEFERTYWTREFGLSRWEKWTRSDLLLGGQTPLSVSKKLLSHATCARAGLTAGKPYPIETNTADSQTFGPVVLSSVNGVYQKVISAGVTYTWYMTLCEDYTNIDRTVTGQPIPQVPSDFAPLWVP